MNDVARARGFYEGLGWRTRASPADDVVFFQPGGMILGLWSRDSLAVAHNPGWTLDHQGNVSLPSDL